MAKVYDLAVKLGEYQDSAGAKKGRWQNVGAVMENPDGGRFIMLDRCFNPAGVPNPENRSTVLLSMFEPRSGAESDRAGRQGQQRIAPQPNRPQQPAAKPNDGGSIDDDIPF